MSKAAIGLGLFGIGTTTAVATPLAMTLGGGSGEGTGPINEQITQEQETPVSVPELRQEAPSAPVTAEKSPTPKVETSVQVTALKAKTPEVQTKPFTPPTWPKKAIPQLTSSSDVQNKYQEIGCLKNHFNNLNKSDSSTEELSSFNGIKFSAGTQSCLVLEYYKQEYTDGKWWGEFRLVWSLKDEVNKRGLIASIDVGTKEGQLLGSASVYILTSEDNKNWKISHKKEKAETKLENGNAIEALIPQADEAKIKDRSLAGSWGFSPKVDNICKGNSCASTNKSPDTLTHTWNLNKNNTTKKEVRDWCSNLGTWFENNFGLYVFENTISEVTGSWKE